MNTPNKLTLLRVCLIPVFLVFMLVPMGEFSRPIALVVFIAAGLTDWLDGYLARKNNLVTNFGKFMDPIADKLLVCSALICFVGDGQISAVIAIIIISREFIISGFRLLALESKVVLAASIWGKFKTVLQMIMTILLIADINGLEIVEQVFIYLATIMTVVSLCDYMYKNRELLKKGAY